MRKGAHVHPSKKNESNLTQEKLKELFEYRPDTGVFIRKKTSNQATVGEEAGSIEAAGYVVIVISKRRYKAHRLAWLYMTGSWPKRQIDHRNRIRSDNRFINLREATNVENNLNSPAQSDSISGVRGVSPWKGKWKAAARCAGVDHYFGLHETVEQAAAAYRAGRARLNKISGVRNEELACF